MALGPSWTACLCLPSSAPHGGARVLGCLGLGAWPTGPSAEHPWWPWGMGWHAPLSVCPPYFITPLRDTVCLLCGQSCCPVVITVGLGRGPWDRHSQAALGARSWGGAARSPPYTHNCAWLESVLWRIELNGKGNKRKQKLNEETRLPGEAWGDCIHSGDILGNDSPPVGDSLNDRPGTQVCSHRVLVEKAFKALPLRKAVICSLGNTVSL